MARVVSKMKPPQSSSDASKITNAANDQLKDDTENITSTVITDKNETVSRKMVCRWSEADIDKQIASASAAIRAEGIANNLKAIIS